MGITGARGGMTPEQKEQFKQILIDKKVTVLHHGDCLGADADAHDIAEELGIHIVVHPPAINSLRAFKTGDEFREAKGYLERDRDIVNESDELTGTPALDYETERSGTWYTLRHGLKTNKPTDAIKPDGTLFTEDVLREITGKTPWGKKKS